jgi:hypothetical protein
LRQRDENGKVRFGASEAPTLMGVNKWATVTDLALSKWSEPEVSEPNAAMERGNILEPSLITYAGTLLEQPVSTPSEMYVCERLIATLDGITDDGLTLVEAKTTTAHSCDDPLPQEYFWQVIAQFACVPTATAALVVVLDKRMRLGHWMVRRDEAKIAELLERADEVGGYLDRRELPPDAPMGEKAAKVMFPDPEGEVELRSDTVDAIARYHHWRLVQEDAEARVQEARDEIAAALGKAAVGTVGGRSVVTFKARKGSRRLNTNALKAAHPDLVRQFMTEGGSTRIFKISG